MPYQGEGARHTAIATKDCVHGQIVTEDGFVGEAFKTEQVDRFVRPADAVKIDADADEEFNMLLGGIQEAPATGAVAAADVGDDVYITIADNVLVLAATALTAGALEAAYLKVGKVEEVDTGRTPDVLRINCTGEALAQVAG